MKRIPLTQGTVALVDDQDYEYLNQWKWCMTRDCHTYYAMRNIRIAKNKRRTEKMHRLILGLRPGDKRLTDHKDGNGLNNQNSNLRICTRIQNGQSRGKWKVCSSIYKGVCWHRRARKWCSYVYTDGKQTCLGYFDSEIDAATAYNDAALKYFGEFALLNSI